MGTQDSLAREGVGLILVRRPQERFVIGENIVVTLVSVGNGYARIGVLAPHDVRIQREEVIPEGE